MRVRIIAAGLLAVLAACTDIVCPGPEDDLAAARARWARQGLTDYSFEYRRDCFCGPELLRWHRVEVRAGRVVAATPLEPWPAEWPRGPLDWYPTVEQLFEDAARPPQGEIVAVTTRFDPALGHPLTITVRCSDRVADCDSQTLVRRLVPMGR